MQTPARQPGRDPFGPARLGPVELSSRVIKAATFEGMSQGNLVTDRLIEFHRRMAVGGVAMTTISYVAVSRDGMGAPNESFVRDAAAEGAKIAAQLGHAGAVGTI